MNNDEQNKKLTPADLKAMTPLEVLNNDFIRDRFITNYNNVHGSTNGDLFFEQEKYNLQRILSATPDLMKCTGFSIYGVMLDVANMGITLENTSRPLLYVLPNNSNVGTKEKPAWEKRAVLEISPYGELDLRIKSGQLLYADRPVVVFEGDDFQPKTTESGQKVVVYAAAIPRQSKNIIGAFIKLVRPDKSFDFFWMLPEDIERLKGYSAKKNKGTANALYNKEGQIDTGFLEAKIIKHAFKTFPKLRLGQFSKIQDEDIQATDYGLDEPVYNQVPAQEDDEEEQVTAQKIADQEGGVTIVNNPDEPF